MSLGHESVGTSHTKSHLYKMNQNEKKGRERGSFTARTPLPVQITYRRNSG